MRPQWAQRHERGLVGDRTTLGFLQGTWLGRAAAGGSSARVRLYNKSMPTTPPLRTRIRPMVCIGLPIATVRFALEFVAPDADWHIGVYYLLPVVMLVLGQRYAWGRIEWKLVPWSMFVMCLIVWGIPNTIAYTTGQFLEWNHGRFHFAGWDSDQSRAAPIAATTLGKIGYGLLQGGLTTLLGTVWCTIWGSVLIWLPARMRLPR